MQLRNQFHSLAYDALYHDTMTCLREFAKKQFIVADTFPKGDFAMTGVLRNEVLLLE